MHLSQVGDLLFDALQVTPEKIDVAHRAQHPLRLIPLRVCFAQSVLSAQLGGPLQPHVGGRLEHGFDMVVEVVVAAVEPIQAFE